MTQPKVTKRPIWFHVIAVLILLIATLISSHMAALYVYILVILGMSLMVIAWTIAVKERNAIQRWMEEHHDD